MRTVKLTQTGVGASAPVVVDYIGTFAPVSWAAFVTGTPTYSVQYTLDDIFNTPAADVSWFTTPDSVNLTSDKACSCCPPIRALRVEFVSGAGDVTITVNQGVAR